MEIFRQGNNSDYEAIYKSVKSNQIDYLIRLFTPFEDNKFGVVVRVKDAFDYIEFSIEYSRLFGLLELEIDIDCKYIPLYLDDVTIINEKIGFLIGNYYLLENVNGGYFIHDEISYLFLTKDSKLVRLYELVMETYNLSLINLKK